MSEPAWRLRYLLKLCAALAIGALAGGCAPSSMSAEAPPVPAENPHQSAPKPRPAAAAQRDPEPAAPQTADAPAADTYAGPSEAEIDRRNREAVASARAVVPPQPAGDVGPSSGQLPWGQTDTQSQAAADNTQPTVGSPWYGGPSVGGYTGSNYGDSPPPLPSMPPTGDSGTGYAATPPPAAPPALPPGIYGGGAPAPAPAAAPSVNYGGAPAGGYGGGGERPVHTDGNVSVRGYYRKDGTYVRPHTRHSPGTSPHSRDRRR